MSRDKYMEKLPEGWKWVRLGEVAEIEMGQSPPGYSYNTIGKGVPFLQGCYEFREKYPLHIKYSTKPTRIVKKGAILLSVRAPVGEINLANLNYCIGRGLAGIFSNTEDNTFLYYLLTVYKFSLLNKSTGSTFEAINKHVIENLIIPLPPLPEQQKIAEILETVDNAIEKTEKIIEKYKRIKQGLMQELLTKGIDENGQIRSEKTHKFKDSPIGRIPEEWEVRRLGEVCERIIGGGTPLKSEKDFWEKGTIPWLTNEEIVDGKINYIFDTLEKITPKALNKTNVALIPPNAVILSLTASVGKVGINLIPITTNQQFNSFIPKKDLFYKFLAYYFLFSRDAIKNLGGLTTFDFISKSLISNFIIPLPPLPEQQRIASILSQIDEVIEKETAYKEKLKGLKNGLMEDLLTGKVRVNNLLKGEI